MTYPRIYNAAVDMVDRNVAQGRGAKAGFHRSQRDADLRRVASALQPHGQPARHLRRPARVARRPAAARYRRFPGRVLGRHQGRRGAGLPQHAADDRAVRLHPGRQPRARRCSSPRRCCRWCSRSSASCRSSSTSSSRAASRRRSRSPCAASCSSSRRNSRPPTPAATRPPSGSTRRARPACPRACATCTRARWRRRASPARAASACARTTSSSPPPSCSSPTASATPCRFRCRSAPPPCCCPSGRRPESVFRTLKQHQPTVFFGVPTLYAAMLAYPQGTPENGSQRLRLCVSAGEALPAEIGKAFKARFGVDILDGVGSTEMLHQYVCNSPGAA